MESVMAKTIGLKYQPVALIWAEEKPEDAKEFKENKWGCVMWMLAAAAKGKTAACGRKTFGCIGGAVGLGFGNAYLNWPGGIDCFYRFLSDGNEKSEEGRQAGEMAKAFLRDQAYEDFMKGEGYLKSPDLVEKFVASLPITDIGAQYVVMKPLSETSEEDQPRVVIFLADPDQLSALVVLANYGRGTNDNVIIPYAAGCQTMALYPFAEAEREQPRAVVGLTDLSARENLKKQLGRGLMSFAMPWKLYQEMEANVPGSFLDRHCWKALMED